MTSIKDIPLFMTPAQLSELTGEHEGSIRRGIREKRIPTDKVNGRWLICRDEIFKSLNGGNQDETKPESTCKAGA